MLTSQTDLSAILFDELELPFVQAEELAKDAIESPVLKECLNRVGSSIPAVNGQDSMKIDQNPFHANLINFISENSENWNIAFQKDTETLYSNEH